MLTEADAGHSEFTDEVYQNESRYPGGEWKAAEEPYTDVVRFLQINTFHFLKFWLQEFCLAMSYFAPSFPNFSQHDGLLKCLIFYFDISKICVLK